MVDEDLQATYLARYYLLMTASGKITQCFWHQLIAPGYGLVDNRENTIRKRKAYYSFKFLTHLLNGAKHSKLEKSSSGVYTFTTEHPNGKIQAVWHSEENHSILNLPSSKKCLDLAGNEQLTPKNQITIDQNVRYIMDKNMHVF